MSLKHKLIFGILVTAITKYSNLIIQLIIGSYIAHTLPKEKYGMFAIISVFIAFFSIFSDAGISAGIVQSRTLKEKDYAHIFNNTLLLGLILQVLCFFSAYAIADYYQQTAYIRFVQILSISLFFNTIVLVPKALLNKYQKFKQIGKISVSVNLISAVFCAILLYKGFSIYALVYKELFQSILVFIFMYKLSEIKFLFQWSLKGLKMIFRYSLYHFLFNFINYFSGNLDTILIGKYFKEGALAGYNLAYTLMRLPVNTITAVITPILHPIMANYQHDLNMLYDNYLKVTRFLALVAFPMAGLLYICSKEIILLYGGEKFNSAILIFKIFCFSIPSIMTLSSVGAIYLASGRTDLLFKGGFINSTTVIIAIVVGIIKHDLKILAIGFTIAININFIIGNFILIRLALKQTKIYLFFRQLIIPFLILLFILTGYIAFTYTMNIDHFNLWIKILIKGSVGGFLCFLALILFKQHHFLLKIIRKK